MFSKIFLLIIIFHSGLQILVCSWRLMIEYIKGNHSESK